MRWGRHEDHASARSDPADAQRMLRTLLALTLLHATVAAADTGGERTRLLVLQPSLLGLGPEVGRVVEGVVLERLSRVASLDVVGAADVKQMMDLEASKTAAGCDEASCLAELAGAMGAKLVVFGDVAAVGSLVVANLSLFNSVSARSEGRVTIQKKSVEELIDALPAALTHLTRGFALARHVDMSALADAPTAPGLPLAPLGVLGAGAAVVLAGAVSVAVGGSAYLGFQDGVDKARRATTIEEHSAAVAIMDDNERAYGEGGQLALVMGSAGLAVGLVATASAIAWLALDGFDDEGTP